MNGKIYLITCSLTDKKYVGQTIRTLKERWNRHINHNWNENIKDTPIQRAFKKYGIENFKIELIVDNIDNQDKLNELEIFYSVIYNTLVPNGYCLKVGERNGFVSDETKKKISESNTGKVRTDVCLKRLSNSHMGNKPSKETLKKISNFFKGKKPSEKTRLGCIEKNSKNWKFISPDNKVVEIKNLKQFCKDNDLTYLEMYSLNSGDRKSPHKEWKRFIES